MLSKLYKLTCLRLISRLNPLQGAATFLSLHIDTGVSFALGPWFSLINQTNGYNLMKFTAVMPWCMRSIPAHASQRKIIS